MRRFITALVLSALAAACVSSRPPEPELPRGTEALADAACENLRSIGCPEGFGSVGGQSCLSVMLKASELRPLPLACWASKKTPAEAKGCGSLRCIR